MADELEKMGYQVQLTPGSGGIFDVIANGKCVFSKKQTGRFPEPGEISRLLQSAK